MARSIAERQDKIGHWPKVFFLIELRPCVTGIHPVCTSLYVANKNSVLDSNDNVNNKDNGVGKRLEA